MKQLLFLLPVLYWSETAAQLTFTLIVPAPASITCAQSTLTVTAQSSYSAPVSFTWTGPNNYFQTGSSSTITSAGIYSVLAVAGTVQATQTMAIGLNTVIPIASSPSVVIVTANQTLTFTAINPTINITHYIFTPTGGTITAVTNPNIFAPGSPGSYTYCLVNNENGCSNCEPGFGGLHYPPAAPATTGVSSTAAPVQLFVFSEPGGLMLMGKNLNVMIFALDGSMIRKVVLKENSRVKVDLYPGLYLIRDEVGNATKVMVP